MDAARVTAIIVNFRTPHLVLDLVRKLKPCIAEGLTFVVVENGSGDDSAEMLGDGIEAEPQLASSVRLIQSAENGGFTGGVNLGVAEALGGEAPPELIWLLNPDANVQPETLGALCAMLAESAAAVASPCIAFPAGQWTGEDRFPRVFWGRAKDFAIRPRPDARWWRSERYDGSCALFDARAVRELIARDGYFLEPGIFMYWDEWDCSFRLSRAGESIVVANTWIQHEGGSIVVKRPDAVWRQYYTARNAVRVVRRETPAPRFFVLLAIHCVRDTLWHFRVRVRGGYPNVRAYWLGTLDGLRGRSGRWKQHPR